MTSGPKNKLTVYKARELAEAKSEARADTILKAIEEVAVLGGTAITVAAATNQAKTIIVDLGYEVSEVPDGWRVKWK